MSLIPVSKTLQQQVRTALACPFRFERHERFAMQQLLQSGQISDLADETYVHATRRALRKRAAGSPGREDGLRASAER
jgi:hypothetical protein